MNNFFFSTYTNTYINKYYHVSQTLLYLQYVKDNSNIHPHIYIKKIYIYNISWLALVCFQCNGGRSVLNSHYSPLSLFLSFILSISPLVIHSTSISFSFSPSPPSHAPLIRCARNWRKETKGPS